MDTTKSDYPLSQEDQEKATALAQKMLALAKGASPAVTAMAGKIVIDLVVFVHGAKNQSTTRMSK